jgi:hypothetical protein
MAAKPLNSMIEQNANKAIVQASFDRWRSGTGGPSNCWLRRRSGR